MGSRLVYIQTHTDHHRPQGAAHAYRAGITRDRRDNVACARESGSPVALPSGLQIAVEAPSPRSGRHGGTWPQQQLKGPAIRRYLYAVHTFRATTRTEKSPIPRPGVLISAFLPKQEVVACRRRHWTADVGEGGASYRPVTTNKRTGMATTRVR